MRTAIIIPLFLLSIALLGCAEKPEKPETQPSTTPSPTKTPHLTPTQTPELKSTPPPPAVSILPPALEIELFMHRYNDRDLDGLLEIFSDEIKANYSVYDFQKELEFAENHSIKIDGWDIWNVTVRHGNPSGVERRGTIDVMLSLKWNGNFSSTTFKLPMICGRHDCRIDGWVVFDQIRETVGKNKT